MAESKGSQQEQEQAAALERLMREKEEQIAALDRMRQETAAQAAELDRLRKEKEEARAEVERARSEFKALSEKIDSEVARAERDTIRQLHAQRKVRIIIPSGRTEHERAPVIVAVNGREFLIVRDREVEVPEGVVNVLSLARELVPVVTEVSGGQRSIRWEDAPRIPFQILGSVEGK